jgi:hypothetical protein
LSAQGYQYEIADFSPSLVVAKPEVAYTEPYFKEVLVTEAAAPRPTANVQVRLAQLQLKAEILQQAILHGYTEAAMCTENDPKVLSSWIRYGKATGQLRDLLAPEKWICQESNGYETTVRPDHQIAVVIASGNSWTGSAKPGRHPSTRNPKGPMTEEAILTNTGHRTIEMQLDSMPARAHLNTKTYVLLHYYDRQTREILTELSLPTGMNKGQIDVWGERLILPRIPFDTRGVDSHEPLDGPPDEYEASVAWKPGS